MMIKTSRKALSRAKTKTRTQLYRTPSSTVIIIHILFIAIKINSIVKYHITFIYCCTKMSRPERNVHKSDKRGGGRFLNALLWCGGFEKIPSMSCVCVLHIKGLWKAKGRKKRTHVRKKRKWSVTYVSVCYVCLYVCAFVCINPVGFLSSVNGTVELCSDYPRRQASRPPPMITLSLLPSFRIPRLPFSASPKRSHVFDRTCWNPCVHLCSKSEAANEYNPVHLAFTLLKVMSSFSALDAPPFTPTSTV